MEGSIQQQVTIADDEKKKQNTKGTFESSKMLKYRGKGVLTISSSTECEITDGVGEEEI